MFRLYRRPVPGEFFCVFGDCSQGGEDDNFVQFASKTQMDIPLVLQMNGVAAEMTPFLRDALNWIYDMTGVKPCVALERNNGGASEMYNLMKYNEGKYTIYYMREPDGTRKENAKPGWDTTGGQYGSGTRPKMLGDWLKAYESHAIRIYDQETQDQHQTFIVGRTGKPEAGPTNHDDAVMSAAGVWQLILTENPKTRRTSSSSAKKPSNLKFHVGG